ncbi:MAG: CDP-alcohol phosphatidyltransferase family protein [Oscillospiraceae bacterium]
MTKNETRHPHAADILTAVRMAGSLALLFLRPLSAAFFCVYTLAGLTDVLDGWIARKTHTASDFGAMLDSMADLLFYTVMMLRIFPALWSALPKGIWYAVAMILIVRLSVYLIAAVKYRRFASLHTYLNKLTGTAVFMIPFLLVTPCAAGYCWAVCAVAALSAWEELAIHLLTRDYNSNTKTIRTVLRERSSEHENSCL